MTGMLPLKNIRVIELGQLISGPFCGQLLGDFGAEIIKIETPDRPDPARDWGAVKVNDKSVFWPIIARNKRSLTLNLRHQEGQDILRQLVGDADVLIENFRPGTLEKWGLGPEVLQAINPRLIITRVSGYGQSGPESHKPGYASVGEAKAGLRHLIGDPDRPPARAGVSLGDTMTGTFAALGTMIALFARERSGRGQIVDAAIYESVMAFMESLIPEYALAGHTRQRTGSILPRIAPSGAYPCRDGMVIIGANQNTLFARLCDAIGSDWASDPRYVTHDARGSHQAELDDMIADWSAGKTMAELIKLCDDYEVPCGPINTAREMLADAHIKARNAIVSMLDPATGLDIPMQAVVPKLSETPGEVRATGPELGADTEAILAELGIGPEEVQNLREKNVV
ncbi:MAG: formyl-CoA transferase [Hyphomonadaceae bacterium]|nr:formyl-CoA transferase [Hyphomonadaceae bacterium]OUX94656.1 MAG: formyl-CoA transferase [Hyphomonas sp. TMED17]